jgi:hypothetical protein
MPYLKQNDARANQLIIVSWILLGVSVLSIFSDFLQYNLLWGGTQDESAYEMNDLRQRMIGLLFLAVMVVHIVMFILWFRRAYYNVHQVANLNPKYDEASASFAWFIPILNLFRPFQIMLDIWEKTQVNTERLSERVGNQLVGWWWATHIITNILSNLSFRMMNAAQDIPTMMNATLFSAIAELTTIPALLLVIQIVTQMKAFEAQFYDTHSEIDITAQLIDDF